MYAVGEIWTTVLSIVVHLHGAVSRYLYTYPASWNTHSGNLVLISS